MKRLLILVFFALLISAIFITLSRTSPSINEGWKTFDNQKLHYSFMYPNKLELLAESDDDTLYMLRGESLAVEFQSYYTFPLMEGQSLENFLDTEPSPAKSKPARKVQVGKNTGYLQEALPGGGELDSVTYLKVYDSRKNQYLAVAIMKGTFEDALPVLETLEFFDKRSKVGVN